MRPSAIQHVGRLTHREVVIVRTRLRPLVGSNAGRRAKPLSMTIVTPSTVTLDSAISVATTTRRRAPRATPGPAPRPAACREAGERRRHRDRRASGSPFGSPGPGEECQDIPGVTLERMMHRGRNAVFQRRVLSPRHPMQIDRERPPPARHEWGIPKEDRDRARVESRRHDEDASSGRRPSQASSVRARPRSAWRCRSWNSSKTTSATPSSVGSR